LRADLLVIDDFAVLAMDPAQAKLAFQVISERYDYHRSTAITTNRPFADWPKMFPDPLNAQVIAERLTERPNTSCSARVPHEPDPPTNSPGARPCRPYPAPRPRAALTKALVCPQITEWVTGPR
jgi:hypothetical protein